MLNDQISLLGMGVGEVRVRINSSSIRVMFSVFLNGHRSSFRLTKFEEGETLRRP